MISDRLEKIKMCSNYVVGLIQNYIKGINVEVHLHFCLYKTIKIAKHVLLRLRVSTTPYPYPYYRNLSMYTEGAKCAWLLYPEICPPKYSKGETAPPIRPPKFRLWLSYSTMTVSGEDAGCRLQESGVQRTFHASQEQEQRNDLPRSPPSDVTLHSLYRRAYSEPSIYSDVHARARGVP